ncbi:hypothetical protein BOTBODRAFT_46137 [Botryobasidium botryosum FD-172 SS1]|uniref:Uncharacterized protein n=1 Tax=Botryobasidium botryosum (strain FD-172 SS1) TaxID=930990 RepID=A0A067MJ41_BOTB1|nr:hypothetical protein BOTBODRAFT_46137 [Botryobasidium botryosum FD-172 SS1]
MLPSDWAALYDNIVAENEFSVSPMDVHPLLNGVIYGNARNASFSRPCSIVHPATPSSDDPDLIKRTLDGLAFVCASGTPDYALALSLTLKADRVLLCVSQDRGAPRVHDFLNTVWACLQKTWRAVSAAYDCLPEHTKFAYPPSGGIPLLVSTKEGLHGRAQLSAMIYSRASPKILSRIHKCRIQYVLYLENASGHDAKRGMCLAKVMGVILDMREILAERVIDEVSAKRINKLMSKLEKLWDELSTGSEHDGSFSICKHISKIMAPFDLIKCLLTLTCPSPALNYISTRLQVYTLPPSSPVVGYPTDQLDWERYLIRNFQDIEHHKRPVIQTFAKEAMKTIKRRGQSRDTVHPECQLLAYHHHRCSTASIGGAPFPYIGSSKSPCYSCEQYFAAYSGAPLLKKLDLPIRESRSKLRDAWAMPHLGSEFDDEIVQHRLHAALKRDVVFRVSDEVDEEGPSTPVPPPAPLLRRVASSPLPPPPSSPKSPKLAQFANKVHSRGSKLVRSANVKRKADTATRVSVRA